jgi:hypothetical protein
MNANDYSINTGASVYNASIMGYSGTNTSPTTSGSLHSAFATNSFTDGNATVPYEIINVMLEEIKKLSKREREIIANQDLLNRLIKEKKIKIIIEIPEEEMI